jgi:DNA-binding NarL/FixJ family response regulator
MRNLVSEAKAAYYEQCVEYSETIWDRDEALVFRLHGAGATHALIARELGMSYNTVIHTVARLRRRMMGK